MREPGGKARIGVKYYCLLSCGVAFFASACMGPQPPAPIFTPAPLEPLRPISSGLMTRDPGFALLLGRQKYSQSARQTSFDAGELWHGTKLYGSKEIEPKGSAVCAIEQTYPDGRRIAVGGSERHLDLVFGLGKEATPSEMPATFSVAFDEAEPHSWQATIFYRSSYLISFDGKEPDLLNRLSHARSLKVSNQGKQDGDYSLEGSERAIQALRLCLAEGHPHRPTHNNRSLAGLPAGPAGEKAPAEVDLDAASAPAPAPGAVDLDAAPAPSTAAPSAGNGGAAKGASGAVDLDDP